MTGPRTMPLSPVDVGRKREGSGQQGMQEGSNSWAGGRSHGLRRQAHAYAGAKGNRKANRGEMLLVLQTNRYHETDVS